MINQYFILWPSKRISATFCRILTQCLIILTSLAKLTHLVLALVQAQSKQRQTKVQRQRKRASVAVEFPFLRELTDLRLILDTKRKNEYTSYKNVDDNNNLRNLYKLELMHMHGCSLATDTSFNEYQSGEPCSLTLYLT